MKPTPIEKYCKKIYRKKIGPLNPYPLIKALNDTPFQEHFCFKVVYEDDSSCTKFRYCDTKDDLIGMVFEKYSTGNQIIHDVHLDMTFSFIIIRMKNWKD